MINLNDLKDVKKKNTKRSGGATRRGQSYSGFRFVARTEGRADGFQFSEELMERYSLADGNGFNLKVSPDGKTIYVLVVPEADAMYFGPVKEGGSKKSRNITSDVLQGLLKEAGLLNEPNHAEISKGSPDYQYLDFEDKSLADFGNPDGISHVAVIVSSDGAPVESASTSDTESSSGSNEAEDTQEPQADAEETDEPVAAGEESDDDWM